MIANLSDSHRLLIFEDSDASALIEALHGQSQVLRKHPVAEMGGRVDHGDLQFAAAEGGEPLPAHETTKIIGEVLKELD